MFKFWNIVFLGKTVKWFWFIFYDKKYIYLWMRRKKKYKCLLANAPWFYIILEIIATHLTMKCHKYIFHMDNPMDWVCIAKYVESILRINVTSEKIYTFFWFLFKDTKINVNVSYIIHTKKLLSVCLTVLLKQKTKNLRFF